MYKKVKDIYHNLTLRREHVTMRIASAVVVVVVAVWRAKYGIMKT